MPADEAQEQPIEERGRILIHATQAGRIEPPAAGDRAELGKERPAGGDEQGDRLCQARPGTRGPRGEFVGDASGLVLRATATLGVRRIEVGEKCADQAAAVAPKGLPGGSSAPEESGAAAERA
jgi:hypothetical protein